MIDCGRPADIENGRVIVVNESTVYGGSAEYHCVPHFNRIGPYLRKCMDDGKWSGEEPRCERKCTLCCSTSTHALADDSSFPLSITSALTILRQ